MNFIKLYAVKRELPGFYMFFGGKDLFFVTDKKRRDNALADAVLSVIYQEKNGYNRAAVKQRLLPGMIQPQEIGGERWYNIRGDGFGGYGSKVNDGQTVVYIDANAYYLTVRKRG